MKHFINERGDIVREAIDGVLSTHAGLARLDGYPAIKVVVRADWDKSRVALISGGGAGHEPAHVGFVGRGMLTAAVSGEVFASPSVDAVLAAILAVTGEAGCLLIVKSYTGDRLNFGLAAEKARALGLRVETVIVADDIAIDGAPQPRGVAGTLFVHKVAGHAAERGASLAEVAECARRVARSVRSIGISLSSCTMPGQKAEVRMTDVEAELGLGIHGEPGVEKIPLAPAKELVATMTSRLASALEEPRVTYAVLVNNLGGVPPIEMSVIMHAVLDGALRDRIAWVVGPAALMTSLDMKGFSLSLLPLDGEIEAALLSEVEPEHWPRARKPVRIDPIAISPKLAKPLFPSSKEDRRRKLLSVICDALVGAEAKLDRLDQKIGDGDTGSTLATAARAIGSHLDELPLADASTLCLALSDRVSALIGGSSGVLLSILTAAMGASLASGATWPSALHAGAKRMQEYGGAQEGDRTMIDALLPAIRALEGDEGLSAAAAAARAGAEKTATMTAARAGRASYLRADTLHGVADPGAVAVALVLEALAAEPRVAS